MSKYAVGTRVRSQDFINEGIEVDYVYQPRGMDDEQGWVVDDPNQHPLMTAIFGSEIRFYDDDIEERIDTGQAVVLS